MTIRHDELGGHVSGRQDSNLRPLVYQTSALTNLSYTRADPAGLEPAISRVTGGYVHRLHHESETTYV